MRFLDVKTDYAFKRVFGSATSGDILVSFLNALLEYEGEHAIVSLVILDPYQAPIIDGLKASYVDVKAVLANGKRIIVEMQVLNYEGFDKRVLYNAAKTYSQQLVKGDDYTLLNPVIGVTLTDFVMFRDIPTHISRFQLMDKQTLATYAGDIELVFVELPKFKKTESELATIQDKWIFFVQNARDLAMVPAAMQTEPTLVQAFDMANQAGMSLEELEEQEKRFDFIRSQRGAIATATKVGLAQGKAEGLAEGLAVGKAQGLEIALARLVATGIAEAEARAMLGL